MVDPRDYGFRNRQLSGWSVIGDVAGVFGDVLRHDPATVLQNDRIGCGGRGHGKNKAYGE